MAPNIRFCFDGWINQPSPVIQCSTDFGEFCSHKIQDITKRVIPNLNYYGTKLTCYLFTGNSMKLSTSRLSSNGSSIQFYYYGEQSSENNTLLHVEFYHPMHDPNIPVYSMSQEQFDGWYDQDEIAKFQSNEQENLKTENVYYVDPLVASQIGYDFTRREKMDMTAWNYIGFGTKREKQYQIQTTRHESQALQPDFAEEQLLGSLYVIPTTYNMKVMREQRAFTVIHGMGIIGGIFGLMIGFQANLFGYRPRSPWGIVHRWSIGLMRKSLLDGLRSRFPNNVHIPIVHPVHRRYSEGALLRSQHYKKKEDDSIDTIQEKDEEEEDENQRMIKLEERLHVFELLFQAYYIDDEVFRSLGNATSGTSLEP
jgi:hypothetical protein